MERTNVEVFAEFPLCTITQSNYFQLADLVGERLSRHQKIAIDLVNDVVLGLGRIVFEKVDGLLPRPALVVHSRINHEAYRTPHVVSQLSKA